MSDEGLQTPKSTPLCCPVAVQWDAPEACSRCASITVGGLSQGPCNACCNKLAFS